MIQYKTLEAGCFYADGGAMFGAIPKRAWSRKYPSDEQNTCPMAMRCLLVWNDERVVLLDTGVGSKELGKLSYYRFYGLKDIRDLVREAGFESGQVTDVVLSHLHFDHCGGCTYVNKETELQVTFPNARHWVSRSQWENYCSPNYLEEDSFRSADLQPVAEAGLLQLIDTDQELFPGFRMEIYEGHTCGQLVSFLDLGDDSQCVFPSDVIPTKAHRSLVWISAYDTHPLLSVDAKQKLQKKIEEKKSVVIYYHDAFHAI